jgi:hypothetical protein
MNIYEEKERYQFCIAFALPLAAAASCSMMMVLRKCSHESL